MDVATTPDNKAPKGAWESFHPDFAKYDVVLSNYNGQRWPERVEKALEEYVANGGGLAVIHAANNAFEGWTEYDKMIGLGWRDNKYGDRVTIDEEGKVVRTPKGEGPGAGHGAQHAFKIVVRDADHPITWECPTNGCTPRTRLCQGQPRAGRAHAGPRHGLRSQG